MEETRWFVLTGGQREGPFTQAELLLAVLRDPDPGSALVWRSGLSEWVPARSLPEVVGLIPPPFPIGVVSPPARPLVPAVPDSERPSRWQVAHDVAAHSDPRTTVADVAPPKYKGVRGWLAWLCAVLLVFVPLFAVINLAAAATNEDLLGAYKAVPGLQGMMALDAVLSMAVAALGVMAGVQLVRVKATGLKVAATYLGANVAYSVVSAVLPSLFGLPDEWKQALMEDAPTAIARASIAAVIWVSYLRKSKRVLATFGRNL